MTEKESIDRGFKHVSTIPCVYDLLNLESTGTWYDDGRIVLNKPSIITKLDRIKFRSFSANIRSDIENLTSPSITGKLCGNFTFYNKPSNTFNPPSSASSDVVDGTEVGILPTISDMSVQIYNQSGYQQYQAANGIYQNGVNNEVTFSEFNVPLVTSFDDSINDMLNYAKYNFTKLLGLFDDSAKNENLYDVSTFVYGEVNTKPYIQELGDNKFINVSYNSYYDDTQNVLYNYQLTYNPSTQSPQLIAGGLQYTTEKYIKPTSVTLSGLDYNPFAYFSVRPSTRTADHDALWFKFYKSDASAKVTVATPWSEPTSASLEVCDFFDPTNHSYSFKRVDSSANGYLSLGSVYQNGKQNIFASFYNVCRIDDSHKMTTIDSLRTIRKFWYVFDEHLMFDQKIAFTVIQYFYDEKQGNPVFSKFGFGNVMMSNTSSEVLAMRNDEYYLLHVHAFQEGNPADYEFKFHILLFYVKDTTLKVLEYRWPVGDVPDQSAFCVNLPDVHRVTTITLPDKLECFANEWNESNYLQYLQELNNIHVTNTPILILPRYVNGSNDFLYIQREYDGETSIYHSRTYNQFGDNIGYNYFLNQNVLYATKYPKDGDTTTQPYQISAVGPMCFLYDGGNAPVADETYASTSYDGNYDQVEFYNKFWVRWNYNRFTQYGRDITNIVKRYNIKFPIFNAFGNYDFTTIAFDYNNLVNITDKITWLVDATGAQVYIKDQTFENIYSFAQSAFMVSFNLKKTEGSQPTTEPVQLYPANPTIEEPTGISATAYSWVNSKHITQTLANPYFYAAESSFSFLDNAFKVDDDGNITFPCIPVVSSDGKYNGLFTFFVKFETQPAIITFDPNVKQSERFANRYNYCKQFLNKTPSLYNDKYPFNNYLYYNNRELFDKIGVFLNLQNTDLTLKLVVSGYPSINSILFYLNEESLVDFKEMSTSPFVNTIECTLVDSNGETLTPALARNIYRNITISADWTFFS